MCQLCTLMALTFTIAGLQTQLQLIATAIDAEDFTSARAEHAKALCILAALPEQVSSGENVVRMRKDLADLKAAIDGAATSSESASADRKRFIRTRLSNG